MTLLNLMALRSTEKFNSDGKIFELKKIQESRPTALKLRKILYFFRFTFRSILLKNVFQKEIRE